MIKEKTQKLTKPKKLKRDFKKRNNTSTKNTSNKKAQKKTTTTKN